MLYVAEQLLFPWLVVALVTGFLFGWYSCSAKKADD